MDYHRHILAVTFTNKATEEMKTRIVRELYRMSRGEDSTYIRMLAGETGLSENEVPGIAREAMAHLLHDYAHFSVVTIDSFFQKVIRAFAREMGLYAAYNVELDQASVLDESIDLMMDSLDQNHFLKDWLVEWAKKKIEEGKSWNFKNDIHKLGQEIFSEEVKRINTGLLDDITDKNQLEPFRKKLEKTVDEYMEHLQSMGIHAMKMISEQGLTVDDFSQKEKGVAGYLKRVSEGLNPEAKTNVRKALDDVSGWYSKTSPLKHEIEQAYYNGLSDILEKIVSFQADNAQKLASAKAVLKQLNVLGILSDLIRYVKEYTRDQNLFLLSEASGFLRTIIADADAPFIYERVGNFYQHFMMDEFQDTSAIQWDNFRPLIDNSLSSGNDSWIVGDVKQSIYRWRNTDWKILSEQVEKDLIYHKISKETLNTNWRSVPEIIHFNNAFFRDVVQQLCQAFVLEEKEIPDNTFLEELLTDMLKAYSDSYQYLPENLPVDQQGYVRLSIVPNEKEDEESWREKVLNQLPGQIESLQDLGYRLSDIAILVRKNEEAQIIADTLLNYRQTHPDSTYRYDVLSNESLLVKNASSVKWLVAAIRFIINPEDSINKAFLQHEYQCYLHVRNSQVKDLTETPEDMLHQWRILPIYELVDLLVQDNGLFLDEIQAPFIQAFQDILLQYTRKETSDLHSFLDWWEENKHKRFVTMPDGQDAIRLITIHKSKGLEFEAVIIPFCEWPLAKDGKILWCHPEEPPFNDLKLLPLKFESSLRNTIFIKDYLREKMFSYIDNLNLLYVAFTRARKTLYIYTPHPQKECFSNISDLIYRTWMQPVSHQKSDKYYISLNEHWHADTLEFELGAQNPRIQKEFCYPEQTTYFRDKADHQWEYVPHITRNSSYFHLIGTNAQIDKGRLLHDIFRNIITVDDMRKILDTMITEGKLPEQERVHIIGVIHQALQDPVVKRWFSKDVSVKTEAEILFPDGTMARPDRVVFDRNHVQVIDYKFGETESSGYRTQIKRYIRYLEEMGYAPVEGFLWYVTLNKVEKVEY
jgi:ATP-dependent exoDNAse (exonuclease V) beta subunit